MLFFGSQTRKIKASCGEKKNVLILDREHGDLDTEILDGKIIRMQIKMSCLRTAIKSMQAHLSRQKFTGVSRVSQGCPEQETCTLQSFLCFSSPQEMLD